MGTVRLRCVRRRIAAAGVGRRCRPDFPAHREAASPVWSPVTHLGDSPSWRGVFLRGDVVITVWPRAERSGPGVVGHLRAAEETSGPATMSMVCRAAQRPESGGSNGCIPPGVVAHHRRHHGGSPDRHRRHRTTPARTLQPGGGHRPRCLRRDGGCLRHRGVVLRRTPVRRRVLRGLADRVLPLGRQPVHLPDHHEQVRRTQVAAAERPPGRHRARADHARHLHRGGRRGDQQLQLDLLPLRPVPGLDRLEAREGGRRGRGRVRGEQADQAHRAQVPGDRRSGTAPS